MKHAEWMDLVQKGIDSATEGIDYQDISAFATNILQAKRIFLMGRGRTGLIVEAFAMRLAQLGLPVFVVAHPTTPAVDPDDLLILFSGSGETGEILNAAKEAREIGADIFAVTQNQDSSLGKAVEDKMIIPSPPEPTKVLNGTLFEMALLMTLDAVTNQLLEISGQNYQEMSKRHANIG